MQLYGVQHGFEHTPDGSTVRAEYVNPAQEMLQAIRDLPRRSIVGIEAIYPGDFEDDGNVLTLSDKDRHYWQTIIEACEGAGHDIAYLDSYGIHKSAAQKRAKLSNFFAALEDDKYKVEPGQARTVAEIMFGLDVEATYLFAVAREDHLIRQVRKFKPDMSIIGLLHSDYVMLSPELTNELAVARYLKVLNDVRELPLPVLSVLGDEQVAIEQQVKESPPNPLALNLREQTVRTYNAVRAGRILLHGEPEWIGSWEPGIRPSGLFEVYPETRETGRIEDRFGTAYYEEGEFDDNAISFTKKYNPDEILDPSAITHPIYYEAYRTSDDTYEGTWETDGAEGEFVIRRGNYLYDPVDSNLGQQRLQV